MVNVITSRHSILNQFISEIRDAEIQKDSLRFRRNLERIGEIFAIEISRELKYCEKEIVTSLGIATFPVLEEYPVLATILRAGLPFHQGFLNIFDKSENSFISAFRKIHKDRSFTMNIEYSSVPEIDGKVVIICDVMIATGASIYNTYKELLTKGKPSHIHIASILTSQEGLNYIRKNLPQQDVTIWIAQVDDELTAQSYLVPGLGDAGDLAFGRKV
jgi:uracil phosphoribosyltransferase